MEASRSTPYQVLIVDDQVENLHVIVSIVTKRAADFEVLQALDAKSALEIARAELPDLIITDWEMPEMNGIQLIQELQADDNTKDIPVIMCTGIMTKSENLQTALDAGAVDYIRKPVDEVELVARIRSMLKLSDSLKTVRKQMKQLSAQKEELEVEKQKSEDLLLNILPKDTAQELKNTGSVIPVLKDPVTVLFTDFKQFTHLTEQLSTEELVDELNLCFSAFDEIMHRNGIEKIKTIGDSYMAAAGLHDEAGDALRNMLKAGLEIQEYQKGRCAEREAAGLPVFQMRVGIHCGPVIAGIVGTNKFQYDIWGDTVNLAAGMESAGEVGKVNISNATYILARNYPEFEFTSRGLHKVKNKGEVEMFFVDSKSV